MLMYIKKCALSKALPFGPKLLNPNVQLSLNISRFNIHSFNPFSVHVARGDVPTVRSPSHKWGSLVTSASQDLCIIAKIHIQYSNEHAQNYKNSLFLMV